MDESIKLLLDVLGLGKQEEIRYQVINITVANPTGANQLTEQSVSLDRDFNRIIGIGYFEVANGNLSGNYNVGFRTQRKQWIDDINIDAWEASTGVGPMFKYYRANIQYGSGDTGYARVLLNGTASSAAMSGQMVLILKKDFVQLPKV